MYYCNRKNPWIIGTNSKKIDIKEQTIILQLGFRFSRAHESCKIESDSFPVVFIFNELMNIMNFSNWESSRYVLCFASEHPGSLQIWSNHLSCESVTSSSQSNGT